jgi:hypothetical protein
MKSSFVEAKVVANSLVQVRSGQIPQESAAKKDSLETEISKLLIQNRNPGAAGRNRTHGPLVRMRETAMVHQ